MANVQAIFEQFEVAGEFISASPFGSGHINDTKLVITREQDGTEHKYVLQKINKNVFKKPEELMENYVSVTSFIREKIENAGGDPLREVINVIPSRDGKSFVIDEDGV